MSDDDAKASRDKAYIDAMISKLLQRAKVDLSLPTYLRPFIDAAWERTLEGCRADLDDGRFCEVTSTEARFGNVKWPGARKVPL